MAKGKPLRKTKPKAQKKKKPAQPKSNEKVIKEYRTHNIIVKSGNTELYDYCDVGTKDAKLFRNSVIYRCRHLFFAHNKGYENMSKNDYEVK